MKILSKKFAVSALISLGMLSSPAMAETQAQPSNNMMHAVSAIVNYELQMTQYRIKKEIIEDILTATLYFEPEQSVPLIKTKTSITDLPSENIGSTKESGNIKG